MRYDYSGIFNVKEEFIFVFTGNCDQGLVESMEVFDVQREIWRVFQNSIGESSTVCNPRQGLETICFFQDKLKESDKNAAVQKDSIHLVGGVDAHGNNLRTVDEFNTKDMKVFAADWRLQTNLSYFSVANRANIAYIAGGLYVDEKDNRPKQSRDLLQITFQSERDLTSEEVELGRLPGMQYSQKQLAQMCHARQDFSLVVESASHHASNFNLFAIGGFNTELGILNSIEKYCSKLNQW